ncbi:beta-lactamase class D/beta-lactamase class D OXA-1 [Collimonas sp. PA-H2]|uniref:penicillin-binding transpeptidase domain-containing protein n=1 Tax=Collimonas sp. PA-H2 TaxID=1881062 RepID=UPI000BF8C556|nr:penicillin-binding transpeptidase domain-containing protein [Collimonas sp. PA-H2]PFH08482.1 beta-lactamase class D/beta-lactamase class D OXA-1 [Collimonas sp. PA-H2]
MKRWTRLLVCGLLAAGSTLCLAVPVDAGDEKYAKLFDGYDACFMLYNVGAHKMMSEYNPHDRCSERLAPNSTFKVPLSLMAFDQSLIDQKTVFKWNGEKYDRPEINRDQTPRSWLQDSALWVSQEIAPQLGEARIKHYLDGFHYGNQDFSGDPGANNGLTHAWLSGSLRISAMEQLAFLQAMLANKLPVSQAAVADTKLNMYLGKLDGGADYYGKTGAGRHKMRAADPGPSKLRDGWFVGFVEKDGQQYIFVSNLTDKQIPGPSAKSAGSVILKPLVLQLLNERFAK